MSECPEQIKTIIEECWRTLPETRPELRLVIQALLEYYITLCTEVTCV